jgi:hypothetical protein
MSLSVIIITSFPDDDDRDGHCRESTKTYIINHYRKATQDNILPIGSFSLALEHIGPICFLVKLIDNS